MPSASSIAVRISPAAIAECVSSLHVPNVDTTGNNTERRVVYLHRRSPRSVSHTQGRGRSPRDSVTPSHRRSHPAPLHNSNHCENPISAWISTTGISRADVTTSNVSPVGASSHRCTSPPYSRAMLLSASIFGDVNRKRPSARGRVLPGAYSNCSPSRMRPISATRRCSSMIGTGNTSRVRASLVVQLEQVHRAVVVYECDVLAGTVGAMRVACQRVEAARVTDNRTGCDVFDPTTARAVVARHLPEEQQSSVAVLRLRLHELRERDAVHAAPSTYEPNTLRRAITSTNRVTSRRYRNASRASSSTRTGHILQSSGVNCTIAQPSTSGIGTDTARCCGVM